MTGVTSEDFCISEIGSQEPFSQGLGGTIAAILEWSRVRHSAGPDTFNPISAPRVTAQGAQKVFVPRIPLRDAHLPISPTTLSDTTSLKVKSGRNPSWAWRRLCCHPGKPFGCWPGCGLRVTGLCLQEKRKRLIPGICRESQDRANHSSPGRDGCAVVFRWNF